MNLDMIKSVITDVRRTLSENDEWVDRFAGYAVKINQNLEKIVQFKTAFHEWKPLYLYMTVGSAKDSPSTFSLRYQGQEVATLNVHKNGTLLLSTTEQVEKNRQYFKIDIRLDNAEWRSPESQKFRKSFRQPPAAIAAKSPEHTLESIFLGELEKRTSTDKDSRLCGIRPVKFADIARFQMCTPLKASEPPEIVYSGSNGGGIDVLARVGSGASTRLCVMELKDKYEFPQHAMEQAVAYATFLQELLASKSGDDWIEIFGFSRNKRNELYNKIKVCVVMPMGEDPPCQSISLPTELGFLELHYIYLNTDWLDAAKEGKKQILTVDKNSTL